MPSDELEQLRAAMDVCNQRLLAVLQERAALVRTIGAWKHQNHLPAIDPGREQAMLEALLRRATGGGYPTTALQAILTAVFAASRELAAAPD